MESVSGKSPGRVGLVSEQDLASEFSSLLPNQLLQAMALPPLRCGKSTPECRRWAAERAISIDVMSVRVSSSFTASRRLESDSARGLEGFLLVSAGRLERVLGEALGKWPDEVSS
jgi:hypothetical protein